MEIVFRKNATILVVLLSTQCVFPARVPPPPPTPGPVGLSVDGGIFFLLIFAILSGFYLTKRYISNKKSSL